MKSTQSFMVAVLLFAAIHTHAQVNIIPQPANVTMPKVAGQFTITATTPLVAEDSSLQNSADFLNDYLQQVYGFKLKVNKKLTQQLVNSKGIFLLHSRSDMPSLSLYNLTINKNGVNISGDDEPGVFYGVQSLIQLLPVEKLASLKVPFVSIRDYPRFEYRGLHLDVCRHFFP